jgi:hypothetical protein
MEKYYTIVTKENQEILSRWRFPRGTQIIPIDHIVGRVYHNHSLQIEKGYNPLNMIKDNSKNGYDFGQYVSFEEFKRLENLTEIEKEMFDIY